MVPDDSITQSKHDFGATPRGKCAATGWNIPAPNPACSHFFHSEGGCIRDLPVVHRRYFAAELTEDECLAIDDHLVSCRRCDNGWDARSSERDEAVERRTSVSPVDRKSGGDSDKPADSEGGFNKDPRNSELPTLHHV